MSWLFSQALVAEYSAANCSDGEPSVQSSGTHTQLAYLSPDRMTAFSRLSRFGMTFKPLTESLGAHLLTWFLEGFRARTSASQEKAQESKVPGLECGRTWRELWAKYDQDSSSWKTLQPSLLGDSDELSPTWPRSGMTADGQCWALPMLGRRTSGTDCGLWPTPCADEKGLPKPSIRQHWTKNGTLRHIGKDGRQSQVKLGEMVATGVKWPTPRACSAMAANITPEAIAKAADRFPNLETVVALRMWPTPQASDNRNRGNLDTPAIARRVEAGKQVMLSMTVSGGALNPTWVEWLMGWPPGWTDLKPLVTVKSHSVRLQHGECFQESVEA